MPKAKIDYSPESVEKEAQEFWERNSTFSVSEEPSKEKFYCLSMFPYPSGSLHMGHVRNYTIGDVISRFQRLLGKNVLQPMGWDAFGLPAENAAIENKVQPSSWTRENIENMRSQLKRMGFAYDWKREFSTSDPEYYKWEQWFFLEILDKGLAYQDEAEVNWDPIEETVLANEQVVDGKGWRSGASIERKKLKQWFLKITNFAEELLEDTDSLIGWPEQVKTMQKNWIGKSEGMQFTFNLENEIEPISVFTTRPDTVMGVTFLAIATDHPLVSKLEKENKEIKKFTSNLNQSKLSEADLAKQEKLGIDTGLSATHPFSKDKIPIWIANFVLSGYGSGALMGVPAHDQRDYEFAKKYNLEIKQVIKGSTNDQVKKEAIVEKNILINSGEFDGLDFETAFKEIEKKSNKLKCGERQINYRLRDWVVSRQRYWGAPIPIVKNSKGEIEGARDLPVLLPTEVKFSGVKSPLSEMKEFTNVSYGEEDYIRETDTFDTFFESSWYYARFACFDNKQGMLDERAKYWLPVDQYVGGIEHAVLHLLYSRFFYRCLRDLGLVEGSEPFLNLLCLGMVLRDGKTMSKSRGNAVGPNELIQKYGADTVRLFVMFAAPPDQSIEWSDQGVQGASRYLNRLWNLVQDHIQSGVINNQDFKDSSEKVSKLRNKTHQTLRKVKDDFKRRHAFNSAVASIMELTNAIPRKFLSSQASDMERSSVNEAINVILIALSPIAPHITHSLWNQLGDKQAIIDATWPEADEELLARQKIEMVVEVNGKRRATINIDPHLTQKEIEELAFQQENIKRYTKSKKINKIIYVEKKLLNLVILEE